MKTLRNLCMTAVLAIALMLIPVIASVQVQAEDTDNYIDYAGETVNFIKEDGSGFGMFEAQEGTTILVDGDQVVIHYLPKNTTVYSGIHWGLITDENLEIKVPLTDGAMDITLPKSVCGKGLPIAPIKPDGTTAKAQYYLAVPSEDKLPFSLAITNNLNMFKAVSAIVKKDTAGTTLLMALSGTGYENLFKGTYDEAVANGDKRDNWIKGYKNAQDKLEFEIKLGDQSYMPIVAISKSYVDKYEAGQNPLARAFYPRQITVDLDAKTIVTDDYQETIPLTFNNYDEIAKTESATLTTTGGPNSNGYKIELNLKMKNDDVDAAFIGDKASAAADGAEIFEISADNTITIPVESIKTAGDPDSIISILDQPSAISFRSKKDGSWMESKITVSKKDKTVVLGTKKAEPKKEVKVGTQATVGGLVYKTTSKTAAALVKPGKKTLAKVTIPATVKIQGQSFKVTAIQAKAFKKNTKLKTLTIGANVKSIGASAFEGCTKISKITIPAAVTTIGNKAFYNCKKATKLVIKGTAIKTFGKKSFAKTGIKKLSAPKKKKAAYKKKLIKAGLKKTVK